MSKYNITDQKEKNTTYQLQLRAAIIDGLHDKILKKLIAEKKYLDPTYSEKQLAIDLNTNTRYLSAVIKLRFQQNYSSLVNQYRIHDALYLLKDPRYQDYNIEDISRMVGFSNRQSFYAAFYRIKGITPNKYRAR